MELNIPVMIIESVFIWGVAIWLILRARKEQRNKK